MAFLLDVPLVVMMGDVIFLVNMVEILNQWEVVSRAGVICLSEDFYLVVDCIQGGFYLVVDCIQGGFIW